MDAAWSFGIDVTERIVRNDLKERVRDQYLPRETTGCTESCNKLLQASVVERVFRHEVTQGTLKPETGENRRCSMTYVVASIK